MVCEVFVCFIQVQMVQKPRGGIRQAQCALPDIDFSLWQLESLLELG